MIDEIEVRGAREHNLRGVNLKLPKNKLIVFTGVSGSGKSSLAFDTLYAEGQRRYIESLSSYARQFLGQMKKPDVDHLSGLSPSISIEQKTGGANPRSTVGTITEIHDFLRVLFARVGRGHCPKCDRLIEAQSREQIVSRLMSHPAGTQFLLLAPVVRNQKGEFKDFFADMMKRGYVRARVDGKIVRLADQLSLDRQMKHNIEIAIDRISVSDKNRNRLAEAIEQALLLSDGALIAILEEGENVKQFLFSSKYACSHCELSFEPPSPQMFSFNSPQGMCKGCDGLGQSYSFDPDLLVPDTSKSIRDGAIVTIGPFSAIGRWRRHIFQGLADTLEFSLDAPWENLPKAGRDAILNGTGDKHITFSWRSRGRVMMHGGTWEGVVPQMLSKYRKASSTMHRAMYERYMRVILCADCNGARLNEQARFVRVAGKTLIEVEAMPVEDLVAFLDNVVPKSLTDVEARVAVELLKEIRTRLGFLLDVGLGYLALERSATTLSGGESQRIRLAGQIGSGLVGVLYVLDEPSIGLHPRDNAKLLASLCRLRDQGNTVLVVEHDDETMRAADYIVDFGPGPGVRGGEVVVEGTYDEIISEPRSVTGQYLSGAQSIAIPKRRLITSKPSPPPASKQPPRPKTPAPKTQTLPPLNQKSTSSKPAKGKKKPVIDDE